MAPFPLLVVIACCVVTQVPRSDTRAHAALNRALQAIGGKQRLERLQTIERVGVRRMSDPAQGARPVPQTDLTPPVLETSRRRVALDFQQGRSATSTDGTIFGGQPFSTRNVSGPAGSFAVNELKRTVSTGPTARAGAANRLSALPRIYPEVILAQALAMRDSLVWTGTQVIGTRTFDVVRLGDGPAAPTLFIDLKSGEFGQQQVVSNRPGAADTTIIAYSDWRMHNGLRVPFTQRVLRNGVLVEELDLRSVRVDQALDEGAFERPAGFETVAAPPLPGAPDVIPLAPDVYLIRRAYNSIAVVMAEYVVILEPVMGPVVSDATLRAVEQIAPGKPVRYVIATHFHADHIGGAKRFIEGGATLVTTRDTARALQNSVDIGAIETVDRHRTLSDASRNIEIYQIGPNPHAAEMLIVYLPKERLLFEGDLLDIDGSVTVPAIGGDDTRALARRIEELGLDVTMVVPVHGRVGTLNDLRQALKRPGR